MTDKSELAELAQRIGRLRPDWQNPERFFEARSEIADALRRLAREQSSADVYKYSHYDAP